MGFHPHMDGGFNDRDVPVADRFDLLRPVLEAILSLGLKDTVVADALCLARTHKLDDCFVDASTSLRAHVLKYHNVLGCRDTTELLGDMINDDLRLWIGDLTRMVQAQCSAATPPQADAVFAMPPMPKFPPIRESLRGGGHDEKAHSGRRWGWGVFSKLYGETGKRVRCRSKVQVQEKRMLPVLRDAEVFVRRRLQVLSREACSH